MNDKKGYELLVEAAKALLRESQEALEANGLGKANKLLRLSFEASKLAKEAENE